MSDQKEVPDAMTNAEDSSTTTRDPDSIPAHRVRAEQQRRRYKAALRCPPLESGHRDPIGPQTDAPAAKVVRGPADVQAIARKWDLRGNYDYTAGWPNYTPAEQRRSDAIRQAENELRSTAKALAWKLVDADEELQAEDIMPAWVSAGQVVRQLDDHLRRVVGE